MSPPPPETQTGAPLPISPPGGSERRVRDDHAQGGAVAIGGQTAVGGQGGEDAGSCSDSLAPLASPPALLSATGLYGNLEAKEVSSTVRWFSPRYWLWSDGAAKERYIYLPECWGTINNSDEDNWSFPVGTRLWKQFSVDGKRIETRLIARHGPGTDDFLFAHYLWNEEETEAYLIADDAPLEVLEQPRGTNYIIPTRASCAQCHGKSGAPEGGLPSRILGFSALQLSHSGPGITLKSLNENGELTHARSSSYEVPGNEVERAAAGYLHANCGFCHNRTRDGVAFPLHPMSFFVSTQAIRIGQLDVYSSAVGHDVLGYAGDCSQRIAPGDAGLQEGATQAPESCVIERMSARGTAAQMPPIDSHQVDEEGLEVIRRWIRAM